MDAHSRPGPARGNLAAGDTEVSRRKAVTLRENFKHLSDADFTALVKAMSGTKHDFFELARAWGFLNEDGTVKERRTALARSR